MSDPSNVGAWLKDLGLGEHETLFAENHIDMDLLPELGAKDLRDLGLPLGHQKRLLRAIKAFDADTDTRQPGNGPIAAAAPSEPAPAALLDGERRHITVMFCDLVGSTALSEQLDPEDLRNLMQAYQKACGTAVERYGGHVAQYLGDGLMVYFGWPSAHEDDAERAVRSAREIVGAIKSIDAPKPLEVHIGIASGTVVVGETGGGDASVPKLAIGETPNLAARLQGIAGPDEIIMAPRSQRLVAGLFLFDDLGKQSLKGIVEPVRAWRVSGERKVEGRFAAAHAGGLMPLVGRDAELALLLERWRQAKDGEGQVVLISGEPGIGKSRIIKEFQARIAGERHLLLDYQCSPYHTHTPYYPITDHTVRVADFGPDDTPETKLAKLEDMIARNGLDVATIAPLFAAALSIPSGDRYPAPDTRPHRQREEISEAMALRGIEVTKRGPVLVLVEDAQWVDATTAETFSLFIERARAAQTLMIISHRPDYQPPWTGFSHATSLSLNRLGGRQSTAIMDNLTGGKSLPEVLVEQILDKTDGIPLFVEELTKTVLESDLVRETGDRYELTGPLPTMAIPETLQDSLMARLDRLAPVKEVAQIGACIGRKFSYALIKHVSRLSEASLHKALDALIESELIFREGTPPTAVYTFKHALVQDAAEGSLLKKRRQKIHADIARAIEHLQPEIIEAQPELLGHHYAEAAVPELAIPYLQRAGERATARSANAEAVGHLSRALQATADIGDEHQRLKTELRIRVAIGSPLIAVTGFASDETVETHARTRALSELLDDKSALFPALYGQCVSHTVRAEHGTARRIAEHFVELADVDADTGTVLMGHRILGLTQIFLGDFAPSRGHLLKTLTLYDPDRDQDLAFRYAQDPGVAAQALLSWDLWLLGHTDQAKADAEKALAGINLLNHGQTSVHALFHAGCLLSYLLRDHDSTRINAERLVALSEDQGIWTWLPLAKVLIGWTDIMRGDTATGLERIDTAFADKNARSVSYNRTLVAAIHAEGLTVSGDFEEAIGVLAEAQGLIAETEEHWLEAELHRLHGVALCASGNSARAEECFHAAIDIARDQAARTFELRATKALAELWRDQGETEKARDTLAVIYAWFDEGFDTDDLKSAKAVLDSF